MILSVTVEASEPDSTTYLYVEIAEEITAPGGSANDFEELGRKLAEFVGEAERRAGEQVLRLRGIVEEATSS